MAIEGVIFFGDSVLSGTGASARELSAAKLVKDSLCVAVSLKARNWNTSQDGLERLDSDVLKQRSLSHVVVLFGNNDCWLKEPGMPNIPIGLFRDNIMLIAQRIKENGQIPIFCNLQPIDPVRFIKQFPELEKFELSENGDIFSVQKKYSDAIQEIAENYKLELINIRTPLLQCANEIIAFDGIHPNDEGHRIIAATILDRLKTLDPRLCASKETSSNLSK